MPSWGYAAVLGASLLLSLVLTPCALGAAIRFGILDNPGPAKSHARAVPYLGGAAIVIAFAATVLVAVAVDPPRTGLWQLVAFLGLGVALALLGLLDDIRGGVSPRIRLAVEVAAAVLIWFLGDSARVAGLPAAANAVVSVIWIVGVTNAFNLLDNMDGLSSGIAALSASAIFGIAALQHRYLVAALAVALVGCAVGFLRHNFHPAQIYMGDAGSLFLGFVLAVLMLKLRENGSTRVGIVVILALAAVPIFDTTLVVLSRLAHRRSPFQGGRDHVSHRLVRVGLTVRQSVAAIYAACLLLDGAALLMLHLSRTGRIAGVVIIVVALAPAGVALMRVPVYRSDRPSPRGTRNLTAERNAQPGSTSGAEASPPLAMQVEHERPARR